MSKQTNGWRENFWYIADQGEIVSNSVGWATIEGFMEKEIALARKEGVIEAIGEIEFVMSQVQHFDCESHNCPLRMKIKQLKNEQ